MTIPDLDLRYQTNVNWSGAIFDDIAPFLSISNHELMIDAGNVWYPVIRNFSYSTNGLVLQFKTAFNSGADSQSQPRISLSKDMTENINGYGMFAYYNPNNALTNLTLNIRDITPLGNVSIANLTVPYTLVPPVSLWMRLILQHQAVTLEIWDRDPTGGGTPIATTTGALATRLVATPHAVVGPGFSSRTAATTSFGAFFVIDPSPPPQTLGIHKSEPHIISRRRHIKVSPSGTTVGHLRVNRTTNGLTLTVVPKQLLNLEMSFRP